MKPLQHASDSRPADLQACAAEILETAPAVFRFIRTEMRRHRGALSVPQFRAMLFLERTPDVSVSALARFLGLSLPAASRLADGLVRKEFATRKIQPGDRRRAALAPSPRGRIALAAARRATLERIAATLAPLPPAERRAVWTALQRLRGLFQPEERPTASGGQPWT